jgi:hypothetical protein
MKKRFLKSTSVKRVNTKKATQADLTPQIIIRYAFNAHKKMMDTLSVEFSTKKYKGIKNETAKPK